MRYQTTAVLAVTLDRHDRQPLHEQIAGHVRAALEHGLIGAETRLPSTRSLADALGVSRGVTTAAYDLLTSGGYVESRPGPAPTHAVRPPGEEPATAAPSRSCTTCALAW